ncbi:hypothetical protein [Amycolatopsis samaneae]|uniref:Lipoprotein n=1 Tax=Amycolatopsis samaneae TaxID=664691 RepID=A0ABW5G9Y0_9PSEU
MKRLAKLGALAALLSVGACGVQPTEGAVPAGTAPFLPATGTESDTLVLYFVLDGRVTSVTRPASGPVPVGKALSVLLRGPDFEARANGYGTELPWANGQIGSDDQDPRRMAISVPFPVRTLSANAVNQLTCTATTAATRLNRVSYYVADFRLNGSDGSIASKGCLTN